MEIVGSCSSIIHLPRARLPAIATAEQVYGSHRNRGLAHIRKIEERAKQQTALIQRLKSAGKDASDAEATLEILNKALQEMRAQIRPLLPTAMDEKRSKSNPRPQRPARKT